jgi:sorbitol-specific phosphotransferase system component IIBC
MKKAIISIITSVAKLLLLSLVCNLVYEWNHLSKVFGPIISYSQWVGIVVIINALVPNGIVNSKSSDDE